MRPVELAGAVADPQEVRGQVVQLGVIVGVVQAQHRTLVVENECFVAGEDLRGVQVGVGDAAGIHEAQAAIDLTRERLVARTGGRLGDELAVPVVHLVQIRHSCTGECADQVHCRAGIGVRAHQS